MPILHLASTTYRIATGPQAGRRIATIGGVTSVKLVEIRVRREVAIGQAARGGIWIGSAVSVRIPEQVGHLFRNEVGRWFRFEVGRSDLKSATPGVVALDRWT